VNGCGAARSGSASIERTSRVSPFTQSNRNQRGSRHTSRSGSQERPDVLQMISAAEKPWPIASRMSNRTLSIGSVRSSRHLAHQRRDLLILRRA